VGLLEVVALSDEEAAAAVGEEHPLVRVQGDGVGLFDAVQSLLAALGQLEEPAVGGVDVEPEVVGVGDVGDGVEVVDRARVGGTGTGDDEERTLVSLDVVLEGVDIHPQVFVAGDDADGVCVGREAGEGGRLEDRVVGLVVDVDRSTTTADGLPCRHHCREVGEGAARGQDALGGLREVEEVGDPADGLLLDLHERGGEGGDRRVAVHGGGDEVGEGSRVQAATGDEGEVPGARGVDGFGRGVADVVEDVVDCVWHRVLEVSGGRRGSGLDEVDDEVEHVVAEGAHLVGARFEGDR
jgi:hypothetical protein